MIRILNNYELNNVFGGDSCRCFYDCDGLLLGRNTYDAKTRIASYFKHMITPGQYKFAVSSNLIYQVKIKTSKDETKGECIARCCDENSKGWAFEDSWGYCY